MRFFLIRFFLSVSVILFGVGQSFATHLRAGEITVERIGCGNSFQITITVYTNTGSPIKFGDGVLDWGDGSKPFLTPTIDNTFFDQARNIGIVTYKAPVHTYASAGGSYIISYLEPNRNANIKNMTNSVNTRFYLETKITIDPFIGCDNSPRLLVPPVDRGCKGTKWYHNPGAYDPDGDSLSFELTIPKKAKNVDVDGYQDPINEDFYRGLVDYTRANETQNGKPTFTINAKNGDIIWDAPGAVGEYNIAFLIKEWRKIGGVYINIGYVTRDMQIVIEDCGNKRPELKVPPDICVVAGTRIDQTITGTDLNSDDVKIEAYSQVFSIQPSPASYTPNPATYQPTGAQLATLKFTWNTTCEHVKEQPYQVVFKITDKQPASGTPLVQFKTWNIRVIGPAPVWKSATVAANSRKANLEWTSYTCKNATEIKIYRRVNSYPWTPPECVTGLPDFLGYGDPIATVSIADTKYVDNNGDLGLAVGAQYCYRLVAIYPSPSGGKSIVSKEICIDPIIGAAPIITNVTIDKTDKTNGQITVKWRSPTGIDKAKYPPPYKFTVYRFDGFSGKINPKVLADTNDSTWVDTSVNTAENVYNYRVQLGSSNGSFVKQDTSASASTVRLEIKPKFKQIDLSWNAFVPWNNKTQAYPRHLIYRSTGGSTNFNLIDSVDVNQNLFHYLDTGKYNKTPLKETETYCYKVLTKGSYGNSKLPEPLLNFSEVLCGQPIINDPPCSPILDATVIVGTKCDDFIQSTSCEPKTFSNILKWKKPAINTDCRENTSTYNIYVASSTNDDFKLYAINVRDTFFIDSNLPSYARCYKISALNRSGKESTLSESFCFDNCPHYELPNVFTPNGDQCNEKFSAYSDRDPVDENGNGPCGKIDVVEQRKKCARFVEKVQFTVVNRWGKEVYNYQSGGERSIYIDWDGKDNSGKELSTGVYYYTADVTFNVVDPAKKNQIIKGWVQLIR